MNVESEVGERRHTRIRYQSASAAIRNKAANPFLPGELLDISISGCLISMPFSFETSRGQIIHVRLDLNSLVLSTLGFVRRADKDNTVLGIEFHRMSDNDKAELASFVDYFSEN